LGLASLEAPLEVELPVDVEQTSAPKRHLQIFIAHEIDGSDATDQQEFSMSSDPMQDSTVCVMHLPCHGFRCFPLTC